MPTKRGGQIQSLHVFAKIHLLPAVVTEVIMLKQVREGPRKRENAVTWTACHRSYCSPITKRLIFHFLVTNYHPHLNSNRVSDSYFVCHIQLHISQVSLWNINWFNIKRSLVQLRKLRLNTTSAVTAVRGFLGTFV